ncbi:guanine deaminase [Ideonella sp.]|uniref:guanine deaminase n=1 Tax=Ideonella sp. TaxID=1929293 RepID=UPI002B4821D0|nr:guanine deaminase [Ideonella sp.]HJV70554.1 guanine deaminase [Ideonella sp.]
MSAATSTSRLALRGDLLDFTGTPALDDVNSPAVRFRPDHWMLIQDGRIVDVRPGGQPPGDDWQREDHRGRLLLPGFIDTHVHCPQLDVIASYGSSLLDWLDTYTFPAEQRFADPAVAAAGSALFLDALLAHGTTAAVVFPTVHAASAEALFAAADERGMRIVTGKVLMDRHAPEGLRDDVAGAERDCEALIARWHGRGRAAFAVTVRFAITSTPAQLAMAGELLGRHAGLYMQTHVAENPDEVRWVGQLFPEARSYLDVYRRFDLLNERSVLAHGIWLDDEDRALLASTGAHIAHCPTSNLFLGSGLFDWRAAVASGHRVSIGTDVGGGTSLSMPRTLAEAYKVQALQGQRLSAWAALHAATRGAAEALGLGHEIGTLEPGAVADVVAWDWAHGPVATHRDAVARGAIAGLSEQALHARVFAWLTLADERNVAAAWVAGRTRYRRTSPNP